MLLDVMAGFVGELRAAGLPVSLTENLDALEALRHVPLDDREAFKEALAATMVKRHEHRPAFETAFDVYFSVRRPGGDLTAGELTADELTALLEEALRSGDEEELRRLARRAVAALAGIQPGRRMSANYHTFRTLRALDAEGALERLLSSGATALEDRLAGDELRVGLDVLRRGIEEEVRRQLVAERGPDAMAKALRKPLPEDVDFLHATRDDVAALRRAMAPLARRMAVRLARKRRHHRRGPLDFRSTVRHSLSYGGVPAEPRFRHPRPSKPEILVIADISGSVAAFARFTLQFVHAISGQFSKVRSFVFIDGIDEVTRLFEEADDLGDALARVNTEADVVWAAGHSDYGHALTAFWERWGREVTPRTSVVVLGDARNNYHAAEAWVLEELRKRARHLYWLNPEPRSYWDTGDSIVSTYGAHCDGVFECRNLRQLERFVEQIG